MAEDSFPKFLFSFCMFHKKDGAGCIAIQKSLLSLQAEPLPMELDKKPYYYNQKHKTMSEEVKIPKTKEECFALLEFLD